MVLSISHQKGVLKKHLCTNFFAENRMPAFSWRFECIRGLNFNSHIQIFQSHVVEKIFKNLWGLSSTFAKQFGSIFSFNSYVYYLTRGFIASSRALDLLTRAFNLPIRAFSLLTYAFDLATCAFILLTRDLNS